MGAKIDLTGMAFGRLIVLDDSGRDKYNRVLWKCLCSCGSEKVIAGQALRRGLTRSCGCLAKETAAVLGKALRPTFVNIIGNTFGRLYVEEETGFRVHNQVVWKCRCVCGKSIHVPSHSLVRGNTQSCGCLAREISKTRFTTHGLSQTKEYANAAERRRRERKGNLDCAWSLLMEICLCFYQPICVICGSADRLATDHVLPLSKGYGLTPGNAVRLCNRCNSIKGTKNLGQLPVEWQEKITYAAESFRIAWSGGF